jgi:hypothetical protein
MLVVTVTNIRKKVMTFAKFSIMLIVICSLIVFIFESFPQKVTLKAWQTNKDHPGRVLRVYNQELPGISQVFAWFK